MVPRRGRSQATFCFPPAPTRRLAGIPRATSICRCAAVLSRLTVRLSLTKEFSKENSCSGVLKKGTDLTGRYIMLFNLSPKQKELLDLVGTLARETFVPRAEKYDREASFPFENYADLRAHNLLALCIPETESRSEGDYQTYCMVAAEMARYCVTTALTLNMHCATTMWIGSMVDTLGL